MVTASSPVLFPISNKKQNIPITYMGNKCYLQNSISLNSSDCKNARICDSVCSDMI